MDIQIRIILDFIVNKSKVTRDIVSSERNEGDFIPLYLAQLIEAVALFLFFSLKRPKGYLAV